MNFDVLAITCLVSNKHTYSDPHTVGGPRRLLTRTEAARYCAVSVSTFDRICGVAPILLSGASKLKRFDIIDLDEWIDSHKVANNNLKITNSDIIDRLLEP